MAKEGRLVGSSEMPLAPKEWHDQECCGGRGGGDFKTVLMLSPERAEDIIILMTGNHAGKITGF